MKQDMESIKKRTSIRKYADREVQFSYALSGAYVCNMCEKL